MSDRIVRQIDPRPNEDIATPKRMSDYVAWPNIILVGDPGAGKSHLFDELATAAKTTVQSARNFLNTPPATAGSTLFIDALDERRAGRTDQTTIDLIVQKLFSVSAARVRLACREHDWLGGTDLAAFHPYFAQSGGHVVLALEPLIEAEQYDILQKTGVTNPHHFIKEAERRSLSEFLLNPQNLIMLAEVVLKKEWPSTRRELLEETTIILLREHSLARSRSGVGRYTVNEVRPPAGAACALRLISDVEGISLAETEVAPLYPSYRTIPFAAPELTLASLSRRAFRTLGNEAVDYSHRVTAEYAAASWLAQQVRDGLPISRVQALIGIEGVPAPELRGMHAWLPLLLPEHSDAFIDADPLGILIYGDATSLSLSQRARLLGALARLAAADPYFRPGEQAPAAIVSLCKPDMVPQLKTILRDRKAPFGIKLLILEALTIAPPLPSLQKEIIGIISDPSAPFGLKVPAVRVAARMGSVASKAVVKICRGLGASANDIRLRAYILSQFYVGHFSAKDISELYNAAAHSKDELITGVLWQISRSIPTHEIPAALDSVVAEDRAEAQRTLSRPNRSELEHFLERLIVRAITERAYGLSGARVWAWLETRGRLRGEYDTREFEGIKPLLAERGDLARSVFDAAVEQHPPGQSAWRLDQSLRENLPFSLSAQPLRWLVSHLQGGFAEAEKRDTLYELAFWWVYRDSEGNADVFESLYQIADGVPELRPIRDKLVVNETQHWRTEERQRTVAALEERRAGRLKNLEQFRKAVQKIKDGSHLRWLTWAADVYFAYFTDVDGAKSPRERLEDELGLENTVIVLDGLKALVRHGQLPSLQQLAEADVANSYFRLWYAFLAGMDELWLETPNLAGFSEDKLKVLVGLDLLLPTSSRRKSGTMERDAHTWKDQILSRQSALVKDTYLFLAEEALKADKQHVSGLYALLNDPLLASFRGDVATYLLQRYPNAQPSLLEDLLQHALTQSPRTLVLELSKGNLDSANALGDDQRQLWALAAYLLAPDIYQTALESYATSAPSIVWRMRALTSYDRSSRNKPAVPIKASQLELLVRIAASHFQNAAHPTGGWSGDENPWDAAEYVRSLVNALSADKSAQATEALQRLVLNPVMASYEDSIKHALANQRARYREMNYKQPSWAETIATLSGGAPANIADLQALVVEHLKEISKRIGTQNNDVYKDFWNEDSHGRPFDPKVEESARNVLLGLLKARLEPLGIIAEPEGHMVADKRADITAALPGRKLILELKRDIHPELWTASATQLDRFYTRDPDASGYGVFGVFWYGKFRLGKLPKHPNGKPLPKTAIELETMINDMIAVEQRIKLRAVVIDVSVPDGQDIGEVTPRPRSIKAARASTRKTTTSKQPRPKGNASKAAKGRTRRSVSTGRKSKTTSAKPRRNASRT